MMLASRNTNIDDPNKSRIHLACKSKAVVASVNSSEDFVAGHLPRGRGHARRGFFRGENAPMFSRNTGRAISWPCRVVVLASLGALPLAAEQGETSVAAAETLLINGHIYTSNPHSPWAEAVAIRGDKIVAVGSGNDLAKYQSASTQLIDLRGRMAMPGIIDNHAHF